VSLRLHPVTDEYGDVVGALATIAEAARLSNGNGSRASADALDMIDAAVVAMDSEGRVRSWNAGARRLFGYSAAETIGRDASTTVIPHAEPEQLSARLRQLASVGSWHGQVTATRRDGTPLSVYTRSVSVDDPSSAFATIDVSIDLGDWQQTQTRLGEARGYLGAVANSMADGLWAVTPDGRLAFMNPAAEEMLGWTTSELKGRVMHSVVHYQRADGSAFPIHECPASHASERGEIVKVEDCVFTRKDGTLLTVGYTASPIRNGSETVGSVVVFRDTGERKAETERLEGKLAGLRWVEQLQGALDAGRVMLYAQPIVALETGATAQFKLQVRVLVDGEMLPLSDFTPHVGSHAIVTEVDRWLLRKACELAAQGHAVRLDPATRSLGDPLLRSEFKRLLAETGADPSKVVFDITEAALLDNPEAAAQFATVMHGVGCQLGLGDFGTGFGGFPYLSKLPVQFLKVTTEFVRSLADDDPASENVIGAGVDLARRFGLQTIAAGVDAPAVLERLRELGVDYARGSAVGAFGPVRDVVNGASS
jgi:PAS domain S-box-containing protein